MSTIFVWQWHLQTFSLSMTNNLGALVTCRGSLLKYFKNGHTLQVVMLFDAFSFVLVHNIKEHVM